MGENAFSRISVWFWSPSEEVYVSLLEKCTHTFKNGIQKLIFNISGMYIFF